MRFCRAIPTLLLLAVPAWSETPAPRIVERYKQMLEKNPVEGTVLDRLWNLYVESGQTAQLIEQYRAPGTAASELVLGHLLRKAGQLDDAALAFERASGLDAASALPQLALARLNSERGQPAKAAAAYEAAAARFPETDPQRADALLQLGAAWMNAGEIEKGAEAWERTVAAAPGNLDLRRRLAESYAANRLPERALPHLESLEAKSPPAERVQALQQIARIHQGSGNQDAAIASFEKALRFTAPGNWMRAELQSQIIRLHQRYHRTPELEERWKKYVEENPRDLSGYLQLVDLYERLGDLEAQRLWLEKLIALAPKNADYRIRRARLLVQLDALEAAATAYDELLAQQPANGDLVFERAALDVRRDSPEAAHRRISALLGLRKDDASLRSRALQFYETHRLDSFVEEHLRADAASGGEESLAAFATFCFAKNRREEARATLRRMIPKAGAMEKRAAAHFRVAQFFKNQNDVEEAVAELAKAIALHPEAREFHLLLGELESSRRRYAEAQRAWEKAFELSATDAERLETDQKLFESLRSQGTPSRIEGNALASVPNPDRSLARESPALQDYLLAMTRSTAEQPTAEKYLRLARWQLWNRSVRMAQEYAQKALALSPGSLQVREFLLKITETDLQSPAVLAHLEELIQLDPGQRLSYRRRAGQIHLQRGQIDEAVQIFDELAKSQPGNAEALTDLAMAQQRFELWPEALGSWQKVYALSDRARRDEATGALLRVYERLGTPLPAAELLLGQLWGGGAVQAARMAAGGVAQAPSLLVGSGGSQDGRTTEPHGASDEKERMRIFQELLAHCTRSGLLDWLKQRLDEQRKGRADDYFTEIAHGRILKAMGQKAAAFEVLADASFAAPNQAEALPELIKEAEELRKFEAAIRLQKQLVRLMPTAGFAEWEKIAQLEERDHQIEAAVGTWKRIVARFPRDATALQSAAAFQIKWGEPARAAEWLRRLRTLDPADTRALAMLAELDLEAGEIAEATECLEQILTRTEPGKPDEPLRFPGLRAEDAARLQSTYLSTVRQRRGRPTAGTMQALRSFWSGSEAIGKNARDLRLNTIRQLAEITAEKQDPQALGKWVERWRATSETAPSEMLWALFHAGANTEMLAELESMMGRRKPAEPQITQAYIWLAMQSREFDRLGKWLADSARTPVERDFLFVALGQHLHLHAGGVEPELLTHLFPEGVNLRLWQGAAMFASRNRFREAALLGRRVFDRVKTQRASYGVELAYWYLYLGDLAEAKLVLRTSLESSGDAFDAPVYTALRSYYRLLPEAERPAFVEKYRRSLAEGDAPLHAAIARTVLAGLTGDLTAGRAELEHVLALGPMIAFDPDESGSTASRHAAGRHWDFIASAGLQLYTWNFPELAIWFWEKALADRALVALQSRSQSERVATRAADVRIRLTALKMARGRPIEADLLAQEFARIAGPDSLDDLAEALETVGAYTHSIALRRRLWEQDPANSQRLRGLLNACRAAADLPGLEDVLRRCVEGGRFRADATAHRDLVLQYLDLLEKRGDLASGDRLLRDTVLAAGDDSRFVVRLAQMQERLGQGDRAEAAYRKLLERDGSSAAVRLLLAASLEKRGKVAEAIEVLEKSAGSETDIQLAPMVLRAGRIDDAFTVLERIPAAAQVAPTLLFANLLVEKGEVKKARAALLYALGRSGEARLSFALQSKVIELLAPDTPRKEVAREFRRLRALAGDNADLLAGCFDLMLVESPRLGWEKEFSKELKAEWGADGDGSVPVGVALAEWEFSWGDPLVGEKTCALLRARADTGEAALQRLVAVLDKVGRAERAAEVQERIARLNPLNYAAAIEWARRLHRLGQKDRALAELSTLAALKEDVAGLVAQTFLDLGEPDRARPLFASAVAADPAARNYRMHLEYAALLRERGAFDESRRILIGAFHNPANLEIAHLLAHLAATGRLGDPERELAAFDLATASLRDVRQAVTAYHLAAAGPTAVLAAFAARPEPGLAKRIHALALKTSNFAKAAALMERFLVETPRAKVELGNALAAVYRDWAANELKASRIDPAIEHLRRAQQLRPEDFPTARMLSEIHTQRGEPRLAVEALNTFLAASTAPGEREKARALLRQIGS